jgi:hypothetical protein
VAWPEAQADVATLEGTDTFDRGLKGLALVSAAASYVDPFGQDATFTAWGSVGIGVAYTAQGVFPKRRAFELVEFNGGVAQGVLLAGDSRRFPSVLVAEARSPVTTLLLYGASKLWRTGVPLDLLGDDATIGLFGARLYFSLDRDYLVLNGWDAELVDILLWPAVKPRSAAAAGILDGQLRVRAGVRAPDPSARLHSMFGGALMLTLEATCGYFTRL